MKPILLVLATVFAAGPAFGHDASVPDIDSWSWCVASATSTAGPVRYFSDPFEGETSADIRSAYVEYLQQAYSARENIRDVAVTCRTDAGLDASAASLTAAKARRPGTRDVSTGWRFHFE